MTLQKTYKLQSTVNYSMIPGDRNGSPDEFFSRDGTVVLIDDGFISKLSKHFGNGEYLKFDKIKFAKNISANQKLVCKHIFYYTAPPFQSTIPTKEESLRYKKYERFVKKLSRNSDITIREGRCQRLKLGNRYIYKQKAVDSRVIIDLMSVPLDYPDVKNVILIASDSDFVPAIELLGQKRIKIILYTYYEKGRDAMFSTSNELIKSVYKYVLLSKQDFDLATLNEEKVK